MLDLDKEIEEIVQEVSIKIHKEWGYCLNSLEDSIKLSLYQMFYAGYKEGKNESRR